MGISAHQYRFLKGCFAYGTGKKVPRKVFESLYASRNVKAKNVVKYVTETLERLIDNEWMIGFGVRTPHKWYIQEVKLSREGARAVKEYERGKQKPLPIKIKSSKHEIRNPKQIQKGSNPKSKT